MKLAVIKTGGKQYLVKEGDILRVEKLSKDNGENIEFETLLVVEEDGNDLKIGNPALNNIKVQARIVEQGRAKKVKVVHYKPKTRYHKVYGHRQPFSKVKIVAVI
ncbi:50S ribosomal protein L21 [Candidatus Kuenenbacteria bacterium CG11_big_fil_rev_8_21_14_0_20_37_9]|nr:MAG: 50S ribosomal protein L21 [Candidatus Kuenenbacteria bacterium CG11_big_fil_rev_8_21_14_0_20_37_9]